MSNHLIKAIKILAPTAEFSILDNDYSKITWDVLEGNAPTKAQINKVIEQIKAEEAAEAEAKSAAREAILTRLGITADEAKILLS
jgi:hypothetical protein